MLISLNWIKKYVDIDIENDKLVELIGARLVEVEEAIDQTHKYDNIFAVEVKYCEAIEGTHLHLCKIDDGGKAKDVERDENGYVQVMCGAPNVHEGMFAAWIAPGAIVPQTYRDEEPFVIGMRKMLKKYDSYGMMAGADELDLGDDHTGIVELDPETTKPGDDFAKLFELDDVILDIENKSLTHRPDTFGIIGFAREVAGILDKPFKTPEWLDLANATVKDDKATKLDIEIADQTLCPRYTALVLNMNSESKKQYLSLQDTLLARSGMRPIDPIVDATNYLMLLTGQPLHAFDYNKFTAVGGAKTPKIIVRAAKKGEKLELLDGKEIELIESDIVITSNDKPVALAGAMGGKNTEIDANTKRVILESATFSLFNLRKTQMSHGIFSEAITRFTKGQPAGQTLPVALEFAKMLKNFEHVATFDEYPGGYKPEQVTVSLDHINGLLGTDYSAEKIEKTLQNVEFATKLAKDEITVTVPYWRTDIHIPEDIIEEVGRLNGFDNIAPILPLHATSDPNKMLQLKSRIRNNLSARGANEVLTYSFVHGDLMQKVGQKPENSYRIVNSISPDLQYIRQSILPSLLDKSYGNLRAGYEKFALFEMNQVYTRTAGVDEDGVPNTSYQLAFLLVDAKAKSNYYLAKKYLTQLLELLGIEYRLEKFKAADDAQFAYYEPKRSAAIYVGDQLIGYLGEVKASVLRGFKLQQGTAGFELNLESLLALAQDVQLKDRRISQYPSVSRDITLELPLDAKYADTEQKLSQILADAHLIYKLAPVSIYRPDGADKKKLSFHIDFAHPDKTMTKDEIQAIMNKLEQAN